MTEPIDTSCIADESLPWMPFVPYSELVSVKLYRADPARGETITVYRAPPGARLPCCRHSGTTTIFTVQGRWKYRELDWVAGPGSVVIEQAVAALQTCYEQAIPRRMGALVQNEFSP